MMRILVAVFLCLVVLVPARADTPVSVYLAFNGEWDSQKLENLIRATLADAGGLKVLTAPAPDALFITIPGGIAKHNSDAGGDFAFTALFSYRGDKLGESYVNCPGSNPKLCADQIAVDTLSAVLATRR